MPGPTLSRLAGWLAIAVAFVALAIYAFEIFDFMTRSWNTALYTAPPLSDCTADSLSPSCYAAFKHVYLGNLTVAEYCLLGLFAEVLLVRVWQRRPLVATFGRTGTLVLFGGATAILCLHSIARIVTAMLAGKSIEPVGLLILYILIFPMIATAQGIALGGAKFPTSDAQGREIKLTSARITFLATSGLIPLAHVCLGMPVDDYGFLLWGVFTGSIALGLLREAAGRGEAPVVHH